MRVARRLLHRTIGAAAEEAGVHWQAWYLQECGCYERILPAIESFFDKKDAGGKLQEEYREFVKSRRLQFNQNYSARHLPKVNSNISPIELFRAQIGVNRTSFAKRICIQPAHLYRLERGLAKYLPEQVVDAFQEIGFTLEDIDEFNERQEDFYLSRK